MFSNDTILGRAVRLPLRLIPAGMPMVVLQGPLRGKRWLAGALTHGCWLGSYEFEKQVRFAEFVKPGQVAYDLGANVGYYTLLASTLVGPQGKVIAFEPVPSNVTVLERHLALNGVTNCQVVEAAVSWEEGLATFEIGDLASLGHLGNGVSNGSGGLRVRTVALDEYIRKEGLASPHVIKCDIEGGEFDALRGAKQTLEVSRPVIFLATHGPAVQRQCIEFLTAMEYELVAMDGGPIATSEELIATPRQGAMAASGAAG